MKTLKIKTKSKTERDAKKMIIIVLSVMTFAAIKVILQYYHINF